jgi:SPP1 family predicted phage head-tail adaptor
MESGRLRHKIVIQTATPTDSTIGKGTTVSFATGNTIWGSFKPVSGNEDSKGDGSKGQVSHEVVIRYHSTISPRDRLLYDSRTFNIVQILNTDELNTRMVLAVKEVTV